MKPGHPDPGRRAVFLDRDGVLNAMVRQGNQWRPPWRLSELRLLPNVAQACGLLRQAGWDLIVVTNQPDVARGTLAEATLAALHRQLRQWLPLDEIRACLHDDADDCLCRKPKPGMLLDAAHSRQLELTQCWMIGDRRKDIEAGRAAGCRTLWVDAEGELPDLSAAANHILNATLLHNFHGR